MAWGDGLRNGLGTLAAAAFAAVVTELLRREQQARAELARRNARLRGYAAQAEELATTQERNRVARDIHDGLGPPPDRRPDAGPGRARGAVHRSGQGRRGARPRRRTRPREALAEVRRSVGALREPRARPAARRTR